MQGDYLPECKVPIIPADFGFQEEEIIEIGLLDLIIMTQSCDLENGKVKMVTLVPIFKIAVFETYNPAFAKKG